MNIVLIKPDGIGDYFLYHNFPRFLKQHFGPNCKITGILSPIVKGLADVLDRDCWDKILWLEPQRLISDWRYRLGWQLRAKILKADLLLYPVISRYSPVDWLNSKIRAKEKIASVNDLKCMSAERSKETDAFYTRLIPFNPNRPRFEFHAYQDFIREWLGTEPPQTAIMDHARLPDIRSDHSRYAMIFPGAGQENREWSPKLYGRVARHLVDRYDLNVVIAGSSADEPKAASIQEECGPERIVSICGKRSLAEVTALAAKASLVLSNDSAPFHMAAALRTPFVMISSTRDYGRYHPYPVNFNLKARFVYPPASDVWAPEKETYEHMKKVHVEAKPNHRIGDVTLEQVVEAVDALLGAGSRVEAHEPLSHS